MFFYFNTLERSCECQNARLMGVPASAEFLMFATMVSQNLSDRCESENVEKSVGAFA